MNDPPKVRLTIFRAHLQHGTQPLVRSQHGAPTCVRHKPRPEKYFGKFHQFFFSATSNHFISNSNFTLTCKLTSEHELSKISTQFFFSRNFSLNFIFFPNTRNSTLTFFFLSLLHTLNFFFLGHLDFFSALSQNS